MYAVNIAASPGVFFHRPFGLRPFYRLASFHVAQVARYLSEMRLAGRKNDSQFFIPPFFNSLVKRRDFLRIGARSKE